MAERDYRVVYKSRVLDKGEDRPSIPTALDPYDHPYASERTVRSRYSNRDSSSTVDEGAATTEIARSSTRTSYPVREDDESKDTYVDRKRSTKSEVLQRTEVPVRRSIVVDPRRDDAPLRVSSIAAASRDRSYLDVDPDRVRVPRRQYYIDETPRPVDGPYVIDTRDGDIIDVTLPTRSRDRGYERESRHYYKDDRSLKDSARDRAYAEETRTSAGSVRHRDDVDETRTSRSSAHSGDDRSTYTRTIGDPRDGNIVVVDKDYSRSRYDDNQSSRGRARGSEYDRESDWRLVDTRRDTRSGTTLPGDTRVQPSRSRAETHSSEDSYVIVSPTSTPRHREPSRSRSSVARRDYPEHELRRRRSRSISFRDSEVHEHDASERRHERPGAEAEIVGRHLRAMTDYDDRESVTSYKTRAETDRRSRPAETERSEATYSERRSERARNDRESVNTYSTSREPDRRSRAPDSERNSDNYRERRSDFDRDDRETIDTRATTRITDRRSRAVESERDDFDRYTSTRETDRRSRVPDSEATSRRDRRSEPDRSEREATDTYASLHDTDGRSRAADSERYASTYRDRDEPYGPQSDRESSRRDRSRRRRRDDETDNASYYSENVTRTTRETRR